MKLKVELTDDEARQLARFVKKVYAYFDDRESVNDELHTLIQALGQVRQSLYDNGYNPSMGLGVDAFDMIRRNE